MIERYAVLLSVVTYLAISTVSLCLIVGVATIGPGRLYRLRQNALPRIRELKPQIILLVSVLLVSAVARERLQVVSQLYGLYLTGAIFAFEGEFVAWLQATFATPLRTLYFSWVYVYGYVFLLVFPFVAYGVLEESTTLKRLMTAYALNYAIGLVCYTVVYAHGPRNIMPDMVQPLLFTFNPDVLALTSQINENTNVFPSLHTSLSVTVGLFALLTRREYPGWAAIATPLALSVVIATMYLGIHWLVDVIAGIALAVGCVFASYRFISPAAGETTEDTASAVE
ncbi:phosphatase PAP2 family protein [Haloparvum sedimenti]|uniref:phosphatase PAP2 family protein n=1 Tax=Haloparvum sedimenti TaxID=1678448 RepID=UPI000A605F62|nr:phosphatase PAP2 family protein [Haloparvum sedimenti]